MMLQRRAKNRKGRDGGTIAEDDKGTIMTTEAQNAVCERLAARYCGVAEGTFRLWRARGIGPAYFRAGEKLIRYRKRDLDAWIESRIIRPSA
jgi:hypothetical protein